MPPAIEGPGFHDDLAVLGAALAGGSPLRRAPSADGRPPRVVIDGDQMLPMALPVRAALGIVDDDDYLGP